MGLLGEARDGLKFACAGLLVAFFVCGFSAVVSSEAAAQGAKEDRFTYFYKNPDLDGLPDTLRFFDASGWVEPNDFKSRPPVIGFLTALFERHPERVAEWISHPYSDNLKDLIDVCLRLAKERNGPSEDDHGLTSLPITVGVDLDVLWGASFATGDSRYADKIIDFVSKSLESGKFGTEDIAFFASRDKRNTKREAERERILSRYDQKNIPDLVLNSSAVWSLGSNAVQHEFVMEAVKDRIAMAPHSDLTYLLRKSVFRAYSPVITQIESKTYRGMLSLNAEGNLKGSADLDAWIANFKNEFALGEPVFIATALMLQPGDTIDSSFEIVSPSGKRFVIGPVQWRARGSQAEIMANTHAVDPSRLNQEGIYAINSFFGNGRGGDWKTQIWFFVGNR